tara:strand:+ start:304 stop:1149 length:846 start_codon:yes stop_codon:yes gene_type:complete
MTKESKLSKYYRAPKLYVRIPSQGAFNPDMETAMGGELAIMAMTGRDETMIKNPDALLNGEAVTSVIKSCVPGIKEPAELPITDIDTLLIAIKIATNGDEHEITAQCPKCKTSCHGTVNLRNILPTAKMLESEYPIKLDTGVTVYIKPYNYAMQTEAALAAFDETKTLQNLQRDKQINSESMAIYNKSFRRMADMSVSLLSRSIVKVTTPDGEEETDPKEIFAFIQNIDSKAAKQIDELLGKINSLDIEKKMEMRCEKESCKNEWTTEVEFNASDFFADGS